MSRVRKVIGSGGDVADVLTVVGFVIVVVQLIQVGRVSSATLSTMQETARQLGSYNLLLLTPELARIERDCERSSQDDVGVDETIDLLRSWRETGSRFRGFIADRDDVPDELRQALQRSLALATRAKSDLVEGKRPVIEVTNSVRSAMSDAVERAQTLSAHMQVQIRIPESPPSMWTAFKQGMAGLVKRDS